MQKRLDTIISDGAVRLIAGLAAGFGVNVYLAGGGVRDCLLGRRVNDLDFALGGASAELPPLFAEKWGGTFFWLDEERLQARVVKKVAGATLVHDFAPLRGTTIEDDLLQRDFTINALAIPITGAAAHLVDPLQGRLDLRSKLVRTCSDHAFDDDPLRLLRALRFAAELGFAVEEGTWDTLRHKTALLGSVAVERIRDELFRILAAPGIGASFGKLGESGLLHEVFPAEITWLKKRQTHGQERQAIASHIGTAVAVERVCGEFGRFFPGAEQSLAAYLGAEAEHGVTVRSLMMLAAFLGSDERAGGAMLAEKLRLGRKAERLLGLLCRNEHGVFGMLERNATERAMFRFFRDRAPGGPGLVIIALACGAVSAPLSSRLIAYYVRDYDAEGRNLLLSGKEIMDISGIGEGKRVGEVMAELREAESRGLVNDREEARVFVKNLLTKEAPMR